MIWNVTELNSRVAQLQRELGACNMLIAIQNQRICNLEAKYANLVLETLLSGSDEENHRIIMSLEDGE